MKNSPKLTLLKKLWSKKLWSVPDDEKPFLKPGEKINELVVNIARKINDTIEVMIPTCQEFNNYDERNLNEKKTIVSRTIFKKGVQIINRKTGVLRWGLKFFWWVSQWGNDFFSLFHDGKKIFSIGVATG